MPKLSKIKFESLILKYINQTSSSNELKILIKALEDIKNVRVFKEYIKTNFYSIYVMNQFETEDIISEIKKRIHRTQKKEKGAVFFKKTLNHFRSSIILKPNSWLIKPVFSWCELSAKVECGHYSRFT